MASAALLDVSTATIAGVEASRISKMILRLSFTDEPDVFVLLGDVRFALTTTADEPESISPEECGRFLSLMLRAKTELEEVVVEQGQQQPIAGFLVANGRSQAYQDMRCTDLYAQFSGYVLRVP